MKKNPFIRDIDNMSIGELADEIRHLSGMGAYLKAVGRFPGQKHSEKFLYFIRCQDTVKIGVSNCPWQRVKDLQTGAPGKLVLMSQIEKSGHRENECHKRLEHLRLYGEWFRLTDEVYQLINELKAGTGQ